MVRDPNRASRLADQIQRDLSEVIRREVKDPRVGLVTITAVELNRDLSLAKVFVTSLEDSATTQAAVGALQHAAGFLRMQLSHKLKVRAVPELRFVYDESVERGVRLSKLIDGLIEDEDGHDVD
jgi:ribosome-binding factor A